MKQKALALLALLFFVILTIPTLAQSAAPSDQETRPGPGYGSSVGPGGWPGYGPGMMGQGYGNAPGEGQYYPNRHYHMMGGGWWIFMFIFMLLFLVLVIAGIVLLVRYLSPHARLRPADDALEVLKRRYARGEIQKAEFEEKRKDLES